MELHHQVLFRWLGVSLLQLRRGMPEDHYVAAAVDPSAYSSAASSPSRIAEAILTLRTMALSTYENRRVTTGTLIIGTGSRRAATDQPRAIRDTSPEALTFGVELTGLKTLHRLCDGRRTVFLVDQQGRLTDLVDIRHWAIHESHTQDEPPRPESEDEPEPEPEPVLWFRVPGFTCFMRRPRGPAAMSAWCSVRTRRSRCSPEECKRLSSPTAAGGCSTRNRSFCSGKVRSESPAGRVLFQTVLDLAEERQGGRSLKLVPPCAGNRPADCSP